MSCIQYYVKDANALRLEVMLKRISQTVIIIFKMPEQLGINQRTRPMFLVSHYIALQHLLYANIFHLFSEALNLSFP